MTSLPLKLARHFTLSPLSHSAGKLCLGLGYFVYWLNFDDAQHNLKGRACVDSILQNNLFVCKTITLRKAKKIGNFKVNNTL